MNTLDHSTLRNYTLRGKPLATVPSEHDLGIVTAERLGTSSNYTGVLTTANATLCFMHRKHFVVTTELFITLFQTYARLDLEVQHVV